MVSGCAAASSFLVLAAPGAAGATIWRAPEPGSAGALPAGVCTSCANPGAATMAMAVSTSSVRVRMGASLGNFNCRDARRYPRSSRTCPGWQGRSWPAVCIRLRINLLRTAATRMPFARAKNKQSIRRLAGAAQSPAGDKDRQCPANFLRLLEDSCCRRTTAERGIPCQTRPQGWVCGRGQGRTYKEPVTTSLKAKNRPKAKQQ